MAEAHISLRGVPPGNCQQFIDKGANKKFVYLDFALFPALRAVTGPLNRKA